MAASCSPEDLVTDARKLKVMTIVGTRPEVIKLSRVIAELDKYTDHVLVHSGQNCDYELNEVFFHELEIRRPDHFLGVGGKSLAQTIGDVIVKSDDVMEKERPHALLLYGDTNTCLCVIPAKRRRIPIFHMEAGNRCFDQRVPEELNRKVVDHLSDINMPLTEHARRYLLAEGLRPETVIKTGSTMAEVLAYYRPKIEASLILGKLKLAPHGYLLASAHREENVDREDHLVALLDALGRLGARYRLPIIVSTHPRTRQRLEVLQAAGKVPVNERVSFLKPFGFVDYVKLQLEAYCVLSDSGTITEESALLGFPAVMLREAHERPEGMDAGTLVMTGLDPERVVQGVELMTREPRDRSTQAGRVADYEDVHVSRKVVQIIQSYVDYVNRTVWSA
jgi:UDP-N-acetylglucosamine 2-epimerase (non-hydrolysing)